MQWYSASAEQRETVCGLLDFQDIGEWLREMKYPFNKRQWWGCRPSPSHNRPEAINLGWQDEEGPA